MDDPKLTVAERLAIVRLEARGVRRACAGIHDHSIDRQIRAIKDKARKRAAGK
ncbi:MAG TPA: hypothetical protein VN088_17040 [Nocardioides sp.]|nr:hypothetical protein [Nocardioides sp.]